MKRTIKYKVVGTRYEGRDNKIKNIFLETSGEKTLILEPDPTNAYDRKAIKVLVETNGERHHVGFIPRGYTEAIISNLAENKCRIVDFSIAVNDYSRNLDLYIIVEFDIV